MKEKDISFTTHDDIVLKGKHFIASKEKIQILLFLGLGGDARSRSVKTFVEALAKHQISTIVFSSRGHADSSGEFLLSKHIHDIMDIEKTYRKLAKKKKFAVVAHSMSGRCVAHASIQSDVILINPGLFHHIPWYAKVPLLDRFHLAIMNKMIFGKVSFTHFGHIHFNQRVLSHFVKEVKLPLPDMQLDTRCFLLLSSQDKVARYNQESIRHKAMRLLKRRYIHLHSHLIDGLDHEFSDHHKFMVSPQLDKIVLSMKQFIESEEK